MSIVWVLAPFAMALGFGFLGAFVWSAARGQCEDLETPAYRVLFEEEDHESLR